MNSSISILFLFIYLVFSCAAALLVIKSKYFDRSQKIYQFLLICLLPVLGAVIILLIYRSFNDTDTHNGSFGGGASASSKVDGNND